MNSKPSKQKDFIVKVVAIGDSGVGKTNILLRFAQNRFAPNYKATVGVDFKSRVMNFEGKRFKMQIWDTAGQQRYKNVNELYFKGAIGVIIVYSVIDRESFNNIEGWVRRVHENVPANCVLYLVGNKSDLEENRKVQYDQGQRLAKKFSCKFMQVSAKTGKNIQQMFTQLGQQVYGVAKGDKANFPETNKNISLEKTNTGEEEKSGCGC